MSTMDLFVLTAAERTTAMGWNTGNVAINPRAVDNDSPGVGINLNDNATNYEPTDPVTLTGNYVAPKRIVDDPDYLSGVPDMLTFLLTLPWCSLETETIFVPIDVIAPSLSSQSATVLDDINALLSVTTDEGNGTLYYVVVPSAAATPSAAQVIAGTDGGGGAATKAGSQAISSTGAKTFNVTALTAATAYKAYFAHQDASGNDSSVVATAEFVTETLIVSRATTGATTGMTASTGCVSPTPNVADSAGGTSAISWVDNNPGSSGTVSMTVLLTFFNGLNHFRAKFKVLGVNAAPMWQRISPTGTTVMPNCWFDLTNGAVGTGANENWDGTPTIAALGNGWYQIDGRFDATGADLDGALTFMMGTAAGTLGVMRNGTNIIAMHDMRLTRAT